MKKTAHVAEYKKKCVHKIAQLLKEYEGDLGKFALHAVPPKQTREGAWHFTLKHQHEGKTINLGKVEDVAKGRKNNPETQ